MANKPLKSIQFPGLSDTYTVPQVDATLATSGAAADAKKVGDEISDLKQDYNTLSAEVGDIGMYTLGLYPQKEVADAAVASFADGADDIPVKSLTVDIEPVQSGSGDHSPSNVRPISGWTKSKVYDCGKNLICMTLDVIKAANTSGTWNGNIYTANGVSFDVHVDANGYVTEIIVSGTSTAGSGYWSELILGEVCVKSGTTYKISTGTNGSTSTTYRLWTTSVTAFPSGHRLSTDSNLGENIARDALANERFLVDLAIYSGYTASNLVIKPMVYLGTITDTTFEPYIGNTYTVNWQTEAGTVYGGTLDVTNGVLTVTNGYVDLGTLNWSLNATNVYFLSRYNASPNEYIKTPTQNSNYANLVCSKYARNTAYNIINGASGIGCTADGYLVVVDTNYADATAFKESLSGVQLVYELLESKTYQLTPTEVATILGQNNIFCDTGNINELTYRADLKAYIDSHVGS